MKKSLLLGGVLVLTFLLEPLTTYGEVCSKPDTLRIIDHSREIVETKVEKDGKPYFCLNVADVKAYVDSVQNNVPCGNKYYYAKFKTRTFALELDLLEIGMKKLLNNYGKQKDSLSTLGRLTYKFIVECSGKVTIYNLYTKKSLLSVFSPSELLEIINWSNGFRLTAPVFWDDTWYDGLSSFDIASD